MDATIVRWNEADVDKGTRILIQGAIMKFLRDNPDKSDEDVRNIEVEYKGHEIEMNVFRDYYVAIVNE